MTCVTLHFPSPVCRRYIYCNTGNTHSNYCYEFRSRGRLFVCGDRSKALHFLKLAAKVTFPRRFSGAMYTVHGSALRFDRWRQRFDSGDDSGLGGLLFRVGDDRGRRHGWRVQDRVVLGHEQTRRRKPEKLRSLNSWPVVGRQVGGEVGRLVGYLHGDGHSRRYYTCRKDTNDWTSAIWQARHNNLMIFFTGIFITVIFIFTRTVG